MKNPAFYSSLLLFYFLFLISCATEEPKNDIGTITPAEMCGTVQFSDGCSPSLDSTIAYGIALLHHMTYEASEAQFDKVIQQDPDCFWGHWGKAMTFFHPLWPDRVSEEKILHGQILSQRAMALAKKEREQYFGKALHAFYSPEVGAEETVRLASLESAWSDAHKSLPADVEASAFYALSMLSTVSPSDKTYAKQKAAGELAESIVATIPDHPGGFHYAIHAYDFPPLAEKALDVARNYGKIAPEIPHALHMPSHIFTRQGLWSESIHWNERSSLAAIKLYEQGYASGQNLHALDYLVYAFLQVGQDQKAEEIAQKAAQLEGQIESHVTAAYSLAAIPARCMLERGQWAEAAAYTLPYPDEFPWENFPQYEALVPFTNGIGAARAGKTDVAEEALQKITALHTALQEKPSNAYWATQVEIKKLAVEAWLEFAKGNSSRALELMRTSSKLEMETEKNPVTPGEILPATELLGDMYLEVDLPGEAFKAYQTSLTTAPNRLNTLYGAGLAAEKMGDDTNARKYYAQLVELTSPGSERPAIVHARGYLEKKEQ